MKRGADERTDWGEVSIRLTILGLIAFAVVWLATKVTSYFEEAAAKKEKAKADAERANATQAAAENAEANRLSLEARCNGGDASACSELAAATTRAREARAQAEAAEAERLRREEPCTVDPGSLACRIDRIRKGDKSECSSCATRQPVFGADMDKGVDAEYTRHAEECCPIKNECNQAGLGFATRKKFGRIYSATESGC